jgi:hypothetical protein
MDRCKEKTGMKIARQLTHRAAPALTAATLLLAAAVFPAPEAQAADSDPRAVELAERTLEAMGGPEAWAATRYLSFHFFGRRTHVWDRYTGRHRVEGKTREDDTFLVLHDIHDQGEGEGRAFVNGQEVQGEKKAELLKNAYGAWVNDTYWLIMPYKMLDPGVHLAYAGEETLDGVTYDKVLLSFEQVGLTPGDRYWAYLNRETGLMDRWAFHLQSMEADAEPNPWRWTGWARYGRILLAPDRSQVSGDRSASLAPIEVLAEVPDSVFSQP